MILHHACNMVHTLLTQVSLQLDNVAKGSGSADHCCTSLTQLGDKVGAIFAIKDKTAMFTYVSIKYP